MASLPVLNAAAGTATGTATGSATTAATTSMGSRLLYCHCAYAKVVPAEVKGEVLKRLSASGVAFDAVADLCEMSARKDPALKRIAESGEMKIAACYPRAVKWLFHAAKAPLPEAGIDVLNMREQSAEEIAAALLGTNGEREGQS